MCPTTLFSDCTNPTVVVGAHVVTSGIIHDTQQVEYVCDTHYIQQTTSVMIRTCTDGEILPNPNNPNNAIKCYARKLFFNQCFI